MESLEAIIEWTYKIQTWIEYIMTLRRSFSKYKNILVLLFFSWNKPFLNWSKRSPKESLYSILTFTRILLWNQLSFMVMHSKILLLKLNQLSIVSSWNKTARFSNMEHANSLKGTWKWKIKVSQWLNRDVHAWFLVN